MKLIFANFVLVISGVKLLVLKYFLTYILEFLVKLVTVAVQELKVVLLLDLPEDLVADVVDVVCHLLDPLDLPVQMEIMVKMVLPVMLVTMDVMVQQLPHNLNTIGASIVHLDQLADPEMQDARALLDMLVNLDVLQMVEDVDLLDLLVCAAQLDVLVDLDKLDDPDPEVKFVMFPAQWDLPAPQVLPDNPVNLADLVAMEILVNPDQWDNQEMLEHPVALENQETMVTMVQMEKVVQAVNAHIVLHQEPHPVIKPELFRLNYPIESTIFLSSTFYNLLFLVVLSSEMNSLKYKEL